MKYKSVIISKKGGPEVLQIVENEFRSPDKEEVLIKIQACGVGGTDVAMRYWNYPGVHKIPFVPGWKKKKLNPLFINESLFLKLLKQTSY